MHFFREEEFMNTELKCINKLIMSTNYIKNYLNDYTF